MLGACDGGGGTNKPPTVALSAPTAGTSPTAGDTVTLAATAADSDGTVAKVGFYVNGALVAEDTTAPFSVAWTARAGVADITARATDDKGATTDTAALRITVQGQVTGDERCRPEGLATTAGTAPAYCKVYDDQGREKMGADKPRRIIGYFTSWRTGKTGQPAFLAHQIPWGQVTHINYAFAHVDAANKLSVGNTADATNPATGLTWPGIAGAEMDPAYAYKGHFNLLNKFKKQYPNVKTLISVGGWAETGGFYDDDDERGRLDQHGRHQRVRGFGGGLPAAVRVRRRRHRLRVPDQHEQRRQPGGLRHQQRAPRRADEELRRADAHAAREARRGQRSPISAITCSRSRRLPPPTCCAGWRPSRSRSTWTT